MQSYGAAVLNFNKTGNKVSKEERPTLLWTKIGKRDDTPFGYFRMRRCVLVPASPEKKRKKLGGEYYREGKIFFIRFVSSTQDIQDLSSLIERAHVLPRERKKRGGGIMRDGSGKRPKEKGRKTGMK